MRRSEVDERDVLRRLVGQQRVLGRVLAVGARLELGQVAVVVALHLEVEDLGLARGRRRHEVVVEEREDGGADVGELLLDLFLGRGAGGGREGAVSGRRVEKPKKIFLRSFQTHHRAVGLDAGDVRLVVLGLLLLLDGGDDAPGGAAGA